MLKRLITGFVALALAGLAIGVPIMLLDPLNPGMPSAVDRIEAMVRG